MRSIFNYVVGIGLSWIFSASLQAQPVIIDLENELLEENTESQLPTLPVKPKPAEKPIEIPMVVQPPPQYMHTKNCGEYGCELGCEHPEDAHLMRLLYGTQLGDHLLEHRIRVGGWTQGGYTHSSKNTTNLPAGWNDRADQFLLQQKWLTIRRDVDLDAEFADWGFRADLQVQIIATRYNVVSSMVNSKIAVGGKTRLVLICHKFMAAILCLICLKERNSELGNCSRHSAMKICNIYSIDFKKLSHHLRATFNPYRCHGDLSVQ
ncbi:MAG: hypothetical protein R3B84_06285 [Zavarzinella sp.]